MNIVILGGSGIISSEITDLAIERGFDVTIINRGKRKDFLNASAKTIIADLKKESIETIKGKLHGPYDIVIDVISYNTIELNRNLTVFGDECKQYIFFSTAVVYKTKNGRYEENDEVGNYDWKYSSNKIECEKMLKSKATELKYSWTIIRPYVTYGKSRIPLQFGPLEYYTIIARAKAGKPIPVYQEKTTCTLTYSKDFAIGLVGLINNNRAYNQVYHITSNCEMTWESVLDVTMKAFGLSYSTFGMNDSQLRNNKLMRNLNASEILGDKGRNMLFKNNKIKNAVPEFKGNTKYTDILPEIVDYFSEEKNQIVNYKWDARVDYMLSKLPGLTKEMKRRLKYTNYSVFKIKDFILYYVNRYTAFYFIYKHLKQLLEH